MWRSDIVSADVSPNGVRAVFEAHGEILTVPAKHGSTGNLTHSPGAMDREPTWSPDGQSIAYFSDAAGEYDLYIRHQDGTGSGAPHPARAGRRLLLRPAMVA